MSTKASHLLDLVPQAHEIIDTCDDFVISMSHDVNQSIRERAISILTAPLDLDKDHNKEILYALPLAMLERGDALSAIWCTETIGRLWYTIPQEIIETIYISATQYLGLIEDDKHAWDIKYGISELLSMLKKNNSLIEGATMALIQWDFAEKQWDIYGAIEHYDDGLWCKDPRSYYRSAQLYTKLWQYDFAKNIIEMGYTITGDTSLLLNSICMAKKEWDHDSIISWYNESKRVSPNEVWPLILYKEVIESDDDLHSAENIIAEFKKSWLLVPSPILTNIAKSGWAYITKTISQLNRDIDELNKKPSNEWSIDDRISYRSMVLDRLKYIQIDVLTFGNDRYVWHYLKEIDRMVFWDMSFFREHLWGFFQDNLSPEITYKLQNKEESSSKPLVESVPYGVLMHVSSIAETLLHPTLYDLHEKQIMPLLQSSLQASQHDNKSIELDLLSVMSWLQKKHHEYLALKDWVRQDYQAFISRIDQKYGTFYRRYIQSISMNPAVNEDWLLGVFPDYPDIALLFVIERYFLNTFRIEDANIYELVIDFWLHQCSEQDMLLFGSMLCDDYPEFAINLLAHYHGMLENLEAIDIIVAWLWNLPPDKYQDTIDLLDKIVIDTYRGVSTFFDYARNALDHAEKYDVYWEHHLEIELSTIRMNVLENKDIDNTIDDLMVLWLQEFSIEAFLLLWEICAKKGWFDMALFFYEHAFTQNPSLRTIELLIVCALDAEKYDIAKKYIDLGLSQSYDIKNYLLNYYLLLNNVHASIPLIIEMLDIPDIFEIMPENVLQMIINMIDHVIRWRESGTEYDLSLQLQALYIRTKIEFSHDQPHQQWILYWSYLINWCEKQNDDQMADFVKKTLDPIVGKNIERIEDSKITQSHPADYIGVHVMGTVHLLLDCITDDSDQKIRNECRDTINAIVGSAIRLLWHFPDTRQEIIDMLRWCIDFHENHDYTLDQEYTQLSTHLH